jgi:diguanylate cyclase (GGDEF)-like protein/PAS domain S-box-containing protein
MPEPDRSMSPVDADHEHERVLRLRSLDILDTGPEPLFDALSKAAALVTGMPIALVTLVDADRQWLKSNFGLSGVTQTARDDSFCTHTIQGADVMEVADTQKDPRFADNPMVLGDAAIRFYAGAPITLKDGFRVGALCVLGRAANALSEVQRSVLRELARVAAEALDQRVAARGRDVVWRREAESVRIQAEAAANLEKKLLASESFLDRSGRAAGVGGWEVDLRTNAIKWSDETCRIHEVATGYRPTMQEALEFYAPEARAVIQGAVEKAISEARDWDLEVPFVTAKGRHIWVRSVGNVEFEDGHAVRVVGAFQDVTLRRRAVGALEASDRRFRKLFQYSLGLICTHDTDGILLSVNPAAARSLGYSIADLLGRPLSDFMQAERQLGFVAYLERIEKNGTDSGFMELVGGDGTLRIWQYHNVLDDEGDEHYVLGHAQDITEQQQHQRKLEQWSVRDPLTGCFNRRFVNDLEASMEVDDRWGCIAFDLDRFKLVNDQFGHQRGDEVLVAMASFLSRHLQSEDALVRLGGDEFLVLMKDANLEATAHAAARFDADRAAAPIGFTMGYATRQSGKSLEQALLEADKRLYEVRALRRTAQQ